MTERFEWLAEPLAPEVCAALDRLARAPDVERVVVLPDVHLASEVCVGTVIATTRSLYPAAVGGDIGCGMAAIATTAHREALSDERAAARVLAGLEARVPILRHAGGGRAAPPLPPSLEGRTLSHAALETERRREARAQLGTLGRGNHFIEVQADDEDRLWLMVHSGSRGLGQAIRAHHERNAEPTRGGLLRLDAESSAGRAYLADMAWALDYAHENRSRLVRAAAEVAAEALGADVVEASLVSCHHNFVACECHGGRDLWVHRKGAIRANPGEPGLIPGSMGTASYHVEGRGEERSLCSSSHGAGRRLARGEAFRTIRVREVARQLQGVFYDHRLTAKLRDEAPGAYKDIDAVLRAQRELTKVRRRLRPVLGFKGV